MTLCDDVTIPKLRSAESQPHPIAMGCAGARQGAVNS